MKNRKLIPLLVYVVALTLLLSWASGGFRMNQVNLSHTQIVDLFRAESVKSFTIQGSTIELTLHGTYDGKEKIQCTLGDPDYFLAQVEDLLNTQKESGVLEGYNFLPLEPVTPIDYVVPLLVAGVVLLLLWFILMSRATAGGGPASNFGKARTVVGIPDGREVTFKDVAGADEEKQELQEVVASRVLPVPGGPTSRRPWGIRAPISVYFLGSLRKSTTSFSSSFSSSAPATSAKVTFWPSGMPRTVRALPKLEAGLPPPLMRLMKTAHRSSRMMPTVSRGKISWLGVKLFPGRKS